MDLIAPARYLADFARFVAKKETLHTHFDDAVDAPAIAKRAGLQRLRLGRSRVIRLPADASRATIGAGFC